MYEAAGNFIGSIVTSGKVKDDSMYAYMVATRAAKWIVSQEVEEYLKREIYEPALHFQALQVMLDGAPAGEDRTKNVECKLKLMTHFNSQYEQLDFWFSEYLQLSH